MTAQQAFRNYRHLFKTRRLALREVCTITDWCGLFLTGTRSDTILVNSYHQATKDNLLGVVLHELIHAEQWAMGVPPDHGTYFRARCKELLDRHNLKAYA